jgi:putative toxin-antitoxin system antitoxin component (TIGR02293 family)
MKTEEATVHAGRKRAATTAPAKSGVLVLDVGRGGSAGLADFIKREQWFYTLSCNFLGGKKFWRHRVTSRSDIHSAIVSGIPYGSLIFFVNQVKGLDEGDVAKVLGISTRTLRRQSETPEKPMPADLASKTWLFAETLAKATEIFGSKEEAERWMSKPAMGLGGQRPIDLLQTVQGAELANDFLGRLEYGVYT